MKICYLLHDINYKDGSGRYAKELISAVKKDGHDIIILIDKNGNSEGIPILKSGVGIFFSALEARVYLKNCDVIHALDGYPYGIIAALATWGLNKKLIITIQGTYAIAPLYSFFSSIILGWAYKKADEIIAISHYTKSEFLNKINGKDVEVINHGIDFEKFYKTPINSPDNFILAVGALKYRKGYHISIPAFALAKKELPNLKYKIVGSQKDINYFKHLKDLAAKNGVQNDIEFLTGLSDEALSDLYRSAKLFILTSVNENHHFEGFGLVFLEAAAAGLSAIGTLDNGIEDAIKADHTGLLVPQNDIKATAEAIIKILSDEKLQNEFSSNSLKWAKDHDWNRVVLKYLSIYER